MIVFEFETVDGDNRLIYWLGCTNITDDDKEHTDEIYEQLMAHEAHLDEGF